MIKRLATSLFHHRNQVSRPFSQANQTPKQTPKQQPLSSFKADREAEFDDEEPKFQKQDRTTPGWMLYRFLFWGSASLLAWNLYLINTHDDKTPVETHKLAIPGFMTAAQFINNNYVSATEYITKPPLDKLLPDPIHPAFQPKTLVLNLTKTLVDTNYVFGKGLIVKKRPGLQQFLKKMAQSYQVIIFSDDDSGMIQTLIPSIDPRHQAIQNFFGHECMVLSGKKYIKDLKYLNRDPKSIVVIDKSKDMVPKSRDNVIVLSQYSGDEEDKQLYHLAGLLESIAGVRDVRKTLQEMGQNPIEKYEQINRQNIQKLKAKQGSKLFGFFGKGK